MKRVLFAVVIAALAVPSLSLLGILSIESATQCEMNPYNGFTCPAFAAYLLPLATIGIVTIIPTAVLLAVWLIMTFFIWRAKKS